MDTWTHGREWTWPVQGVRTKPPAAVRGQSGAKKGAGKTRKSCPDCQYVAKVPRSPCPSCPALSPRACDSLLALAYAKAY